MYGDLVMDSVPEKVRKLKKNKSSMISWLAVRKDRTLTWVARELDQIANITCLVMGYNLFETVALYRGRMALDIVSCPCRTHLIWQLKASVLIERDNFCAAQSNTFYVWSVKSLKRFWTKFKMMGKCNWTMCHHQRIPERKCFFSVTYGRKLNWYGRFCN